MGSSPSYKGQGRGQWGEGKGPFLSSMNIFSQIKRSQRLFCPVPWIQQNKTFHWKMGEIKVLLGCPGGLVVKNLPANAGATGDVGLIPGLRRSPGVGNGSPLLSSCWDNSVDRGAWWTIVHKVSKSQTNWSHAEEVHAEVLLVQFWDAAQVT